jgi:hypothetical protein
LQNSKKIKEENPQLKGKIHTQLPSQIYKVD